jgi:hypothetical protein
MHWTTCSRNTVRCVGVLAALPPASFPASLYWGRVAMPESLLFPPPGSGGAVLSGKIDASIVAGNGAAFRVTEGILIREDDQKTHDSGRAVSYLKRATRSVRRYPDLSMRMLIGSLPAAPNGASTQPAERPADRPRQRAARERSTRSARHPQSRRPCRRTSRGRLAPRRTGAMP